MIPNPNPPEYPINPDNGLPEDDTGDIVFKRISYDKGVTPPPAPASIYLDDQYDNYQYESPLHYKIRKHIVDDATADLYGKGFVIPFPGVIGFSPQIGSEEFPQFSGGFQNDGYVTPEIMPNEAGTDYPVHMIDSRWTVEGPEGTSVLCIEPFISNNNEITVIPRVYDLDVGPTRLKALFLQHESEFRIPTGDPLMQVIPFKKDALGLPAIVETK